MKKTRTRFAPSPTGFMHLGNLRTAIIGYVIAKHDNGDFILRVEDTDQVRKVDGAIDFIYDTLKICDIKIDEGPNNEGAYGPYIQSERKEIYLDYAKKLVENGNAYYCFCSEERLNDLREKANNEKRPFMYDGHCQKLSKDEIEEKLNNNEPYVIRQKMPKTGETLVEDIVYGKISIDNSTLEDQILIKSDGFPTYNFANVIDDHLMEISHVIRGKEYLSQSAKYNLLYDAFNWERPDYIHVPMVLGEDGTKLSKRNGDASFMDLYNDGYLPGAIINYLILLGWSPKTNTEVFSMEELIENFDMTRINKDAAQYDKKKLNWFNSIYIKQLDDTEYLNWIKKYLKHDISNREESWINKLLLIYKDHLSYGEQINELTNNFFNEEYHLDDECTSFMNSDEIIPQVIDSFKKQIENITSWEVEEIKQCINNVKNEVGAKGKLLFMPIRIKTSGLMHGSELADTIYLIGKDKILERLSN